MQAAAGGSRVSNGKDPAVARALALVVCAGAAALGGCAAQWASPREPYAPPRLVVPTEPAFRVLDHWRWADTVEGGASPAASALAGGSLGLYPAAHFRLASGHCEDCRTPEAVLWYFRDEVIAVPDGNLPMIGLDRNSAPSVHTTRDRPAAYPSLVWLGAPQIIEDALLSEDGTWLMSDAGAMPLALTPRLPTNRAYVDASTARFFARRPVRIRGASTQLEDGVDTFVARTLWPQDARIEAGRLRAEPLRQNEMLGTLIEAQPGGETEAFPTRVLWERSPGAARELAGKPVLAIVLSGAQGDDDGGRGGHLGIATGAFGSGGEWSEWVVDNFYPLDDPSAKGIIPASLPMDNYLFDVNSGQLYYRPGYMLVAVFDRGRVPSAVQTALHGTMLELYCRDVEFHLSRRNSTSLAVDPIRSLGWRIPPAGPTSRVLAVASFPVVALGARSLRTARDLFSAFVVERTRLLPRVAFEVMGHDLLYLAAGDERVPADLTSFEQMLVDDIEALLFVRLPQVPSERRVGTYPVRSLLTYGAQVQANPQPFESAPLTPLLEFPAGLEQTCRPD